MLSAEAFAGLGEKRETGTPPSEERLRHTLAACLPESSRAIGDCTREGARGRAERGLSGAAPGHTPHLLTVRPPPDSSELFHKPFKGYHILFL